MKKENRPVPVAFHGIALRARDPEALARRARAILGWRVLRKTRGEIVLGDGPELFLRILRGEPEGVVELHLAVQKLSKSRRRTEPDDLGGDSRSEDLIEGLALTLREFQRAPGRKWKKRRPTVS